ncbi:hypothetical protein CAOG_02720 [Capsaspora owczarzaki ATCC 30864]|uniref:YEATS domain-containing protein n=1 Tax=Capsaspora owczarzaki (strain ATCC 30864) TaxID=595528 RepID=A0A0D2VN27_CAPO3|nr:hypothetical protein CAOG_02720 [Capsaspora owczarzaki ATCC 30864]KJE91602.1 hypothetical protein CAOG_002720 [Capsaspora owczarzaki ATCC 30864]|eukprot:XP_004349470.2 hypothetical protein CAOG_02720 [Capsaspora owczarzaki ATCC 30864]
MASSTLTRKILVGNEIEAIPPKLVNNATHTYRWTVFVRSESPTTFDLSSVVSRVEFQLLEGHFKNPRRQISSPPYQVVETGWGSFDIPITVYFKDASQAPVKFVHPLHFPTVDNTSNLQQKTHTLTFVNPSAQLRAALLAKPTAAAVAAAAAGGPKKSRRAVDSDSEDNNDSDSDGEASSYLSRQSKKEKEKSKQSASKSSHSSKSSPVAAAAPAASTNGKSSSHNPSATTKRAAPRSEDLGGDSKRSRLEKSHPELIERIQTRISSLCTNSKTEQLAQVAQVILRDPTRTPSTVSLTHFEFDLTGLDAAVLHELDAIVSQ